MWGRINFAIAGIAKLTETFLKNMFKFVCEGKTETK